MAQRHRQNQSRNPLGGIVGLGIILILAYIFLKVVFGAVSMVWGILAFVAPLLFIVSMFLNFDVIKDYFKMLTDTFRKDTGKGLLYTAGSLIGYPLVSLFLFYKAFNTRKKRVKSEAKVKNKKEGEDYVKFEEVDEVDNEDFLELPDIEEAEPESKPLNRYDDLFSE